VFAIGGGYIAKPETGDGLGGMLARRATATPAAAVESAAGPPLLTQLCHFETTPFSLF